MGTDLPSILPPLDPEQTAQAEAVLAAVRAAIARQGGWLSFEDYLRCVLYAPGLGYYSAGSVKFGREGDFITAPELSTLFGRCLARQCAELLTTPGADIVEFGAGSGALAAVLLPALAQLGALPAHYRIVEISADLIARQRARLATLPQSLAARVCWHPQPPVGIDGVWLANEVADALPFRRFVVTEGGFLERGVTLGRCGELVLADRAADRALSEELERLGADLPARAWPAGYESEVCVLLDGWIATLAQGMARGALLVIDYGLPRREYYHPQRSGGTLRCHYRHRAHADALLYPGLQDITAWVDFTRVAEAASAAGLEVSGFCTQAAFLLALGIEAEIAGAQDTRERAQLAAEARQLLLPGEMGEHFKVMALTRALPTTLRGFAYQDLRQRL